jgi:hypothetical protein
VLREEQQNRILIKDYKKTMGWINKQKQIIIVLFISLVVFSLSDFILSNLLSKNQLYKIVGSSSVVRISHEIYHHDLAKNININETWGEEKYILCTNEFGFKDSCDLDLNNKSSKHFDVAFIGDSFTEAVGIEYEKSFVGLFATANPNLKVANLGVSSYSPTIYFKKIEFLLQKGFTFSNIVVFPDISDIQDEGFYYLLKDNVVKSKVILNANIVFKALESFKRNYGHNFLFTNLLINKLRSVWRSLHEDSDNFDKFNKVFKPKNRALWTHNQDLQGYGELGVNGGVSQALESMKKLKELLDKNDIKLSIGVYPWKTQLQKGDKNHRGVSIWKNFCTLNSCANFINVNPYFFDKVRKYGFDNTIKNYYIPGDVHFNKLGNDIIFNILSKDFKL